MDKNILKWYDKIMDIEDYNKYYKAVDNKLEELLK